MGKRKHEAALLPDDENPEFRSARPALDVMSEVFGPEAADALRRKGGRPAKPDRKINQTLRLDPDVVEAYRQEGPGWQAQMNRVLREHMPRHGK
jgi:uncharacterized protein (DUF4415 family)